MNTMKGVLAAALLVSAAPAFADEVVLRNGAVFTGVVREEGDRVIVEVDFGTVTFKRIDVKSIRRTEDPIKEYEERVRGVQDAKGYYEVALWARDRGLSTRAGDLLKKVIALDPDHEGARKALGYEKLDGRWLSADEAMVAKGFVKHRGQWLRKETVEKILEEESRVRVEVERAEAVERVARLQREVELAKVAAERERIELERQRDRFHVVWVARLPVPCGCRGAHLHKRLGRK